jgi:hypothetical protein
LFEAVLQRIAEPMPLIVLADPGPVATVRQSFPTNIVGGRPDVFAADYDVRPLGALVTAVAEQRNGFLMNLDLTAVKADRHQRFDQGFAVFEARLAFNVV